MRRVPSAILVVTTALALAAGGRAQQISRDQFRADFSKGLELADNKLMDQVMRKDRAAAHAALYFEELYVEKQRGDATVQAKLDALKASWERCFENSQTLAKIQRWLDGMDSSSYDTLQKGRNASSKVWNFNAQLTDATRIERLKVMHDFMQLATNAKQIGHQLEVAEIYGLAAAVGNQIPDKTLEDRKEALQCVEEFLLARKGWEFAFDVQYLQSAEFAKAEKLRIAEAEKAGDKRRAEGYDPNAKGIDSYLMPNAKDDVHALAFELQANFDELDYGPKNGPVAPLWWNLSLGKEGGARKFDWFRTRDIYLARTGANKFGISLESKDLKKVVEVEVSGKPKASQFWLDGGKTVPYAMFFWAGSDKERVGEAECNLQFTTEVANIYYRSAAAWKTAVGADPLWLYDDNCNGQPGDTEVFEPPFKVATLGDHTGEGTPVPLLDSMRVGKGPRVPFSEFVKLSTGWFHLRRDKDKVALRPLNPEYMKTGKIKLVWAGPKPSAPVQLVVKGEGDFKTAFFDVAGGKEVEVPAANYAVEFGRILVGKGARALSGTIYRGNAKSFTVEPGKTFELKMGAPFKLEFDRQGDDTVVLDALKIGLHEASGCAITELHGTGMAVAPEVLAAKAEDGKGQKPIGKFLPFTDAELLNKAAAKHGKLGLLCACFPMPEGYRDGEMQLKLKLPAAGWKVALAVKKHSVFDKIGSAWK